MLTGKVHLYRHNDIKKHSFVDKGDTVWTSGMVENIFDYAPLYIDFSSCAIILNFLHHNAIAFT